MTRCPNAHVQSSGSRQATQAHSHVLSFTNIAKHHKLQTSEIIVNFCDTFSLNFTCALFNFVSQKWHYLLFVKNPFSLPKRFFGIFRICIFGEEPFNVDVLSISRPHLCMIQSWRTHFCSHNTGPHILVRFVGWQDSKG